MINTVTLLNKIVESGKSGCYLAKKCDLSYSEFIDRIINRSEFESRHIKILCDELNIESLYDKKQIFFPE